jgi:hypothetical protein
MDASGGLMVMVLGLVIMLAVFLVCRAIVLWYWKVDKIVSLLESIDKKLGPEPVNGSKAAAGAVGQEY